MIVDRTPQDNAAVSFQRPGLSFQQGRYNGYNPLFAGNQISIGKAADWNWLSLYFSTAQSALQTGAVATGGKLTNVSIFGLSLPDQPSGQILFPNSLNVVTSSSALFWDQTSFFLKITSTGAKQLRLSYDSTHFTDFDTDLLGDLTITPSGGTVTISGNLNITGTSGQGILYVNTAFGTVSADPLFFYNPTSHSVSINTGTPNVNLDVNGGFALRQTTNAQITSDQNNYAIGSGTSFLLNSDAQHNITGLTGGFDGKLLIIENNGSFNLLLVNEGGLSSTFNRFRFQTGTDQILAPGCVIMLQYDASLTRWKDVA